MWMCVKMARKTTVIINSTGSFPPDFPTEDYLLFEEWLAFGKADGLEDKTLSGHRHNVGRFLWW
jgi:hypothetical protein